MSNSKSKKNKSLSTENPVVVLSMKNKVQMAKPLYNQLVSAKLSLPELKLIDVYLSAINSHNPDSRVVTFEKGELEKLFGVKRIQQAALTGYFRTLLSVVVLISSEEEDSKTQKNKLTSETLFKQAYLEYDKSDGLWKATMECGELSADLIFNIEKKGYLQHTISSTAKLQSLSSFLLLKFLESKRNNKGKYPQFFEVSLEELREQLNLTDKYPSFKEFNRCVLASGLKEITEKTNIRFEYEPIRQGRTVRLIRFKLLPRVSDTNALPEQLELTIEDTLDESYADNMSSSAEDNDTVYTTRVEVIMPDTTQSKASQTRPYYHYDNFYDKHIQELEGDDKEIFAAQDQILKERISLLAGACCNEFSPNEMMVIYNILRGRISDHKEMFTLLERVYLRMEAQTTEIVNRFSYFCTMLENVLNGI